MVKRVIEVATGSIAELANDAGISDATIYAWAAGRRRPSPENLRRLADALRTRGDELDALAADLEAEAGRLEGEG